MLTANIYFFFPALRSGAVAAPVVVPVGGTRKQSKRRKFTLANGITVWATDESYARLASVQQAPPEPIEIVPADTAPEAAPDEAIGRHHSTDVQARRTPDREEHSTIRDDGALLAATREILRLRAEEEIIILHLLMDEAA